MFKKKILVAAACLVCSVVNPIELPAQSPDVQDPQAIAEKIVKARGENLRALKEYSWNQSTEIRKDGEIISTKLELVRYDSVGKEQRSTLSQIQPEQKKRIAGRVQKKKMGEMQAWGEEIKALLLQYSLPDIASLNNFLSKTSPQSSEVSGQIVLNARNVIQQGDRITMHVRGKDKQIEKTEVFTSHEMDPVHLEISHGRLPDGINYIKSLSLSIRSKGLGMTVENFNYNRD